MKNCPVCNKPLKTVSGLGYVCVTSDCPVMDDADLWVNKKRIEMNTLKEQMQLTKDKLYGYDIECSHDYDPEWSSMKGPYFNFEKYTYRRKPREPGVLYFNNYLEEGATHRVGHLTHNHAKSYAKTDCIGQSRFVEDMDWKCGEENE